MLVKAITPPLFSNIGRGQITRHFWRHVRKTYSCWLFTTNHATGGYAYVRIGAARWRAHRFSWVLHFGPIPEGVWVLHTCDVPCCVNPQHLWLGSAMDNTADCIAKGRYRLPFHAVGEDNGRAILTPATVRVIRNMASKGVSYGELVKQFGVTKSSIARVVRKQSWSHVC